MYLRKYRDNQLGHLSNTLRIIVDYHNNLGTMSDDLGIHCI